MGLRPVGGTSFNSPTVPLTVVSVAGSYLGGADHARQNRKREQTQGPFPLGDQRWLAYSADGEMVTSLSFAPCARSSISTLPAGNVYAVLLPSSFTPARK